MKNIVWIAAVIMSVLLGSAQASSAQNIVVGQLVDQDGRGISAGQSFPLTLLRFNADGVALFVAQTNCKIGQGCPDANGAFVFSQKDDGSPLPSGNMIIHAETERHLHGFKAVAVSGNTQMGQVVLQRRPAEIRVFCNRFVGPDNVLSCTGSLVRLDGTAPLPVDVVVALNGPGPTSSFMRREKQVIPFVLGGQGTGVSGLLSARIAAGVPPGGHQCLDLAVYEAGTDRQLSSSGSCSLQVGATNNNVESSLAPQESGEVNMEMWRETPRR